MRVPICVLLLVVAGMHSSSHDLLRAAEPAVVSAETRTYDILVDGKKSGQSRLRITRYGDGSESVSADAKVTVTWTVFSYVYEFHGKEQWRDGHFEQLESRAVDGGTKLSLSVKREGGGFRITKGRGKPASAAEVQLTTNYWREPAAGAQSIAVLDADTGKLYDEKLDSLGKQELTIGGQKVMASAYRLKGKLDVELWFDAQGFLVQQIGKEDGHPTEVRLASMQEDRSAESAKER
jgi:hypothetical protein